ncbi:MAG: ABC transporter ATP-binding protein [Stellaceae bacterium]
MTGLPASTHEQPLLRVEGLQKYYPVHRRRFLGRRLVGEVRAVDDVSFTVPRGETLGLVGESGCGKTTTARAILHLIAPTAGRVWLGGSEILGLFQTGHRDQILGIRRRLQYVFQDPYLSLNPRWTVEQTLREPFRVHSHIPREQEDDRIVELLERVGLEETHASRYPHEFSGGQRQRVGIARALAVQPEVLLCDEPVSSLDVSVRAQILNLLVALQETLGLTYLYISHDLSSVRFISTRVAVMYLGRIVEMAEVNDLFDHPLHHYTCALLAAIPAPDPDARAFRSQLHGEPPSPMNLPRGCRFQARCPAATAICREVEPLLSAQGGAHLVACHHPR